MLWEEGKGCFIFPQKKKKGTIFEGKGLLGFGVGVVVGLIIVSEIWYVSLSFIGFVLLTDENEILPT